MRAPWLWRKDGVGWGHVCIRETGIQTAVVYERHRAGENTSSLAKDYGVAYHEIVAAIAYELGRRHKRTREWREALEDEQ